MKIYRYLSEDELNNIINGNVDCIGAYFKRGTLVNTHQYIEDEKYLHFFKYKQSMAEIRNLYRSFKKPFYFCEFEVPKLVLFFAAGKGYYLNHGYKDFENAVTEYAIKVVNFKPSWLKSFVLDKDKNSIMTDEMYENLFTSDEAIHINTPNDISTAPRPKTSDTGMGKR